MARAAQDAAAKQAMQKFQEEGSGAQSKTVEAAQVAKQLATRQRQELAEYEQLQREWNERKQRQGQADERQKRQLEFERRQAEAKEQAKQVRRAKLDQQISLQNKLRREAHDRALKARVAVCMTVALK